ncbi:LysR family transcriptional regulator [Mycolicibacterium boenickei]|nr:LysR family transcriptional regulator [Mycolicibacterium boenickei]
MEVEVRHLRALVALADHGTHAAAAAALHLTQPTLSRTVGSLNTSTVGVWPESLCIRTEITHDQPRRPPGHRRRADPLRDRYRPAGLAVVPDRVHR